MINLRMTDNREDIREWTGLSADNYDQALWDAGFDLDDWDVCFESDTRLIEKISDDDETWAEPKDDAYWLVRQMENYCCGFDEVEYNGKWYYLVHHAQKGADDEIN